MGFFNFFEKKDKSQIYYEEVNENEASSFSVISNIYSDFISNSKVIFEKEETETLLKEKGFYEVLFKIIDFVQKSPLTEPCSGYLLLKHNDIKEKKDPLGIFDDFEFCQKPSFSLDRHKSRAISLKDFRDSSQKNNLIKACQDFDNSYSLLKESAKKASKIIKTSQKTPSLLNIAGADKKTIASLKFQSSLLEESKNFILGAGEEIKPLIMDISPQDKNFLYSAKRVSFFSGIDLISFLDFESINNSGVFNQFFINNIKRILKVWLYPLVSEILEKIGIEDNFKIEPPSFCTQKEEEEIKKSQKEINFKIIQECSNILKNEEASLDNKNLANFLIEKKLKNLIQE